MYIFSQCIQVIIYKIILIYTRWADVLYQVSRYIYYTVKHWFLSSLNSWNSKYRVLYVSGVALSRVRTKLKVLECPWIWKQKFKALYVLEFVKKYWKALALVYGYFLKLFDIQNGHFVELILHVHLWQSCLKLIKVTSHWTSHFTDFYNPFSSVFSPCGYMALNVLKKSVNLTLPHMYKPCLSVSTPGKLKVFLTTVGIEPKNFGLLIDRLHDRTLD
jgi:hypothetical protein